MKRLGLTLLTVFGLPFSSFAGGGEAPGRVWAKVQATNQFQRSLIANTGVVIEHVGDDFVAITGIPSEIKAVEKSVRKEVSAAIKAAKACSLPDERELYTEIYSDGAGGSEYLPYTRAVEHNMSIGSDGQVIQA